MYYLRYYKKLFGYHDRFSTWSVSTFVFALVLIGPFGALFVVAAGDSGGLWPHLLSTVFPRYVTNTLILMAGVAGFSLVLGITTGWVVARFKFPAAGVFEWALLLPATVPAYIIAYTYTDLLEYAGPIQGLLREIFGWQSARDYWFPEIRSMGGAILVMSSVLYPYVYLMARTAFRSTPAAYLEVALLHNRNFSIAVDLPLARPAIVAGLALVLMEVVSDFGTVEYFAIETLTLGVYNVWIGMHNLTAAAQIAIFAFIFILGLLYIEKSARSRQRFTGSLQRGNKIPLRKTDGKTAIACVLTCLLPITLGFLIPVTVLAIFVFKGLSVTDFPSLITAASNSLIVSAVSALCIVFISSLMVLTTTYKKHPFLKFITAISATGYAFPGVVLAIGVVAFSGAIDSVSQMIFQNIFNIEPISFLIGSTVLLIIGYIIRFQAIGYGAMGAGVNGLSPNIMSAGFISGRSFTSTMLSLGPPLLRNSMIAAGLLVFVDVMKELPMTLLLRPFNFETLSTFVYQFAKDELLEEAALAALGIVIAGLIPVLLLNASQRGKK
ncbi:MAG: ABC transporter permease [Rhodospirillaceae bacterium]|nr:ABC transporter permease [Rhodospirillaceae bacterium]